MMMAVSWERSAMKSCRLLASHEGVVVDEGRGGEPPSKCKSSTAAHINMHCGRRGYSGLRGHPLAVSHLPNSLCNLVADTYKCGGQNWLGCWLRPHTQPDPRT